MISHLADAENPLTTLCGLPWEDWQIPDMPTDEDIGLDRLPPDVRALVRQSDAARQPPPGATVHQCQACFKAAKSLPLSGANREQPS
jgi:hypothetical protein